MHPECRPEGDRPGRLRLQHCRNVPPCQISPAREFIIGTEAGMIYRLKENPDKEFYPLSEGAICQNMKKTDLAKLRLALQTCEPRVVVPERVLAGQEGDREDAGGAVRKAAGCT